MRSLAITNTAIDLLLQVAPFQSNYTVTVFNLSSGSLVLQECDTSAGSYTTLATIAANSAQDVTFDKEFVKVSTSATLYAVGN